VHWARGAFQVCLRLAVSFRLSHHISVAARFAAFSTRTSSSTSGVRM
jgi:hypothetical protein